MKRRRFLFLPALAILLLLIGLLGLGSQRLGLVHASGTTVQVTNCNDSGPGSLRDAIASAASGSTIIFSLSCDIKLNSTLTISKTLTLNGEGHQVTLDGQQAVRVLYVNAGVTLTLKALTIAKGFFLGRGGGIFNAGGTVSIINSTVSGNFSVGILNQGGSTLDLRGNIVANNTQSNCLGILTDQGYNLSSDTSCHFTASTSLQNTDPKLDPAGLANNGGQTQTIALQPDSPAVDQIPVGSSCPATDQRGVPRPQGSKCDIGAFEMTAADGLTVMIHVVNSFHLAKGLQTSLDQQLQTVLADLRAQHTAQACQDLTSFINHVKAQSGKGLTTAQATQLLKEAAVIHTRLGC